MPIDFNILSSKVAQPKIVRNSGTASSLSELGQLAAGLGMLVGKRSTPAEGTALTPSAQMAPATNITPTSAIQNPDITLKDPNSVAAQLLQKFEGFTDKPYYDVNAYRVGYGSDTITTPDGKIMKVTSDMNITKEDAERDLTRRIGEFTQTAINQVGLEYWNKLPTNAQAALISVTYNYGSLPKPVVSAVKSGDVMGISDAVAGLQSHDNGVNRKRRLQEAKFILS